MLPPWYTELQTNKSSAEEEKPVSEVDLDAVADRIKRQVRQRFGLRKGVSQLLELEAQLTRVSPRASLNQMLGFGQALEYALSQSFGENGPAQLEQWLDRASTGDLTALADGTGSGYGRGCNARSDCGVRSFRLRHLISMCNPILVAHKPHNRAGPSAG